MMMTKSERGQLAKTYRDQGLNCAQSVLLAFRDQLGLSEEQCYGLGSGLGGGVRYGGICGTVNVAVMVLGQHYPHTPANGAEGKQRAAKLTKEFERRFRERFGALDCRELLAVKDLKGTPLAEAVGATAHCDLLVVSAIELLCDMLEELEKE
jgi:C_GCAxxG_C_C family probable redox protein